MLSPDSLRDLIEEKISENWALIQNQPERAFDQMMKIVMSEVRGKVDAKQVVQMVKELLASARKGN
jgi:Glu-tRNA(Gln) amidotransferase subunit E-like FAD-binding protein